MLHKLEQIGPIEAIAISPQSTDLGVAASALTLRFYQHREAFFKLVVTFILINDNTSVNKVRDKRHLILNIDFKLIFILDI